MPCEGWGCCTWGAATTAVGAAWGTAADSPLALQAASIKLTTTTTTLICAYLDFMGASLIHSPLVYEEAAQASLWKVYGKFKKTL